MRKTLIIIAILGSLVLSHAQSSFEANLDGLQVVPPNVSPAFGLGDFSLSGTTLSVTTGTYQDLLGTSTAVTLHDAAPGVNGPVIFLLTLDSPGTTTGTFSGSGALTAGQITDLDSGNFYVSIHSTVFPGGEIRGQLEPVPEPTTMILMGAGSLALLAMRRRKV